MICRFLLTITLLSLATAGCAQKPDLIKINYEKINYVDGISEREAIYIAQKEVRELDTMRKFKVDQPMVVSNLDELPHHEKYWFIRFEKKDHMRMETYQLIAVDKETGKIKYSGLYYPEKLWTLYTAFY